MITKQLKTLTAEQQKIRNTFLLNKKHNFYPAKNAIVCPHCGRTVHLEQLPDINKDEYCSHCKGLIG